MCILTVSSWHLFCVFYQILSGYVKKLILSRVTDPRLYPNLVSIRFEWNWGLTLSTDMEASDFYKWRSLQAYVIVGENDSPAFISQAKEFCGKLKNSGFTQAILEIIDEKDHFDLVEKLSEKEDVLTQLMLKCIK